MESVKKNWPQIAVGVAAIAISLYILQRNSKKNMASMLIDYDQIKGNEWPQPRRIIDCRDKMIKQKLCLDKWMDSALKNYVSKNGTFVVDQENNLKEEDFFRIYDLIESVGKYELQNLRKKNEGARRELFQKSFVTGCSA